MHRTINPAAYDSWKTTAPPDDPDSPRARAQLDIDSLNANCEEIDEAEDQDGDYVTLADVLNLRRGHMMPRDHHGPQPGKCFLSLNLPASDMLLIQNAVALARGDAEESLVKICREWLKGGGK